MKKVLALLAFFVSRFLRKLAWFLYCRTLRKLAVSEYYEHRWKICTFKYTKSGKYTKKGETYITTVPRSWMATRVLILLTFFSQKPLCKLVSFPARLSLKLKFFACRLSQKKGVLKDPRDGKTYKTIVIGTQTWLAENLNYKIEGSYCYDNDESNGDKYGRLYTWEAAKNACPNGWHLPSIEEWKVLVEYVEFSAGKYLKTTNGWKTNGTDDVGFSALPGGSCLSNGRYSHDPRDNGYGCWWSSTESEIDGIDKARYFLIKKDDYYTNYPRLHRYDNIYDTGKSNGLSVRCIKD